MNHRKRGGALCIDMYIANVCTYRYEYIIHGTIYIYVYIYISCNIYIYIYTRLHYLHAVHALSLSLYICIR